MSLFDKLKNKRSSLQEKKDDTTGKGKKPIKVNIQDLQKKISKNPKLKNVGVKTTDTIKQSEVSKQAKKFTKKINKKNINRPEGVIGDTYVSTTKKGKIRSAKKVNPTLKKSISQVKGDIEFKQSLKKAGASGDVSDTAPKKIRDYVTKKREIRADKLGLKDPFKIDTSKAAKENQKIFKNIGTGSKGKSLPVSGFGKGITKGQANVKDLQKSSFKITQPKDVKVPASFLDFSRKINKLKTDVAKTASSTPRTVTKKYKPTTTVKQSEVSKKAKAFTNQISQQKKAKTNKVVDLATKKQQSKLSKAAKDITQQRDDAIVKREKLRSVKGKKDVKDIRLTNRKVGDLDKLSQTTKKAASGVGNPNAPVKYNKMTAGTEFIKNNQKTKTKLVTNPVPKKTGSQIMKQNEIRVGPTGRVKTKGPQLLDDITVKNTPREIRFAKTSSKVLAKTPKALKPVARPALKLLAKAGAPGRIAAAGLSVAALSPAARKAAGQLATGVGLTALFGRGKKDKALKVGDGLTKVSNMPSKYQPKGMKSGTFKEPGSNKVRGTGDVRVRFDLASGGGKKRNPTDVARVKNIQKNYIDDYNKKAAKNPFKKAIKYDVNKDGTYTVTPPKKK